MSCRSHNFASIPDLVFLYEENGVEGSAKVAVDGRKPALKEEGSREDHGIVHPMP